MKITLCGSTRFRADWERVNVLLTKAGHTVYSVSSFERSTPTEAAQGIFVGLTSDEKETLDLVHLNKILESDLVIVVGEQDGRPYVGDSTRREIKWAKMQGKNVIFQYQLGDEMHYDYLIAPLESFGR